MKNERIVYLDYLRVISIIAVIVIHMASQNFDKITVSSPQWSIFVFYSSISRWAVPVFIMISGSLFIERDINIKTLYSKNILRLLIAYFTWNIFYAVSGIFMLDNTPSLTEIASGIITGVVHMWFIPMIIGVYMCIPLLKQITKSKTLVYYFLILSVPFTFIFPQIVHMADDFIGGFFAEALKIGYSVITDMELYLILGFPFYFLLGYLLNKTHLDELIRYLIYAFGTIGFLTTFFLNIFAGIKTGNPFPAYNSNFSINVFLEAIAIHTWFKYRKYENDKFNHFILKLSKYSFGAYLVHIFAIRLIKMFGLNVMMFSPIISVPVLSALVVVISYTISSLLNKIPKLNKWIV